MIKIYNKIMKFFSLIFIIIILSIKPTFSGPFSDKLSQCMIRNISDTDNRILTNWIASVMVQHPQIDIEMSSSDIEFYNKSIALLFEDLLTVRCRQETADALTFESEEAFASAFEILGIVSMEKLIEHPSVISASENVINYIDLNKLSKIFE